MIEQTHDTYCHTEAREFKVGDRVEHHPASDLWMRGARYGTVTRVGKALVWVQNDKTGRVRWWHPESLRMA